MDYDFETMLTRYGVGSTKWEEMRKYGITPDMHIMPMSNAEMEFSNAPEIKEGLKKYIDNTVMAYFKPVDTYYNAVTDWMRARNDWNINKEWIVPYPGIHGALSSILEAFTAPGDEVIVMPPTWPGFFDVIENFNCVQIDNPLISDGNSYFIDFEDLENKASSPKAKILFFCSPQNPAGRVWTREELQKIADICIKHNILIVSDEAHSDIIMPGYKHIPLASLESKISNHTITCTAPTKTFNIAGLEVSNIIIENQWLREKFKSIMKKHKIFRPNMLAMKACELAYAFGSPWLDECIKKIDENRKLVEDFFAAKLPMLPVTKLEATYLMWIDMRPLGLSTEELERALMYDAHVFFDDGYYFGEKEGAGFERVNIACPTKAVQIALDRLYAWVNTPAAPAEKALP